MFYTDFKRYFLGFHYFAAQKICEEKGKKAACVSKYLISTPTLYVLDQINGKEEKIKLSFSEALKRYEANYITDNERKIFSSRLQNNKQAHDVLLSCFIPT